jgi:hypothetical protein
VVQLLHDLIGLTFAVINLGLGFLTIALIVGAVRYFKTGLLVKALKRTWIPAIAIALFFLAEALEAIEVLPSSTPIDDILGTIFMVGFLYVARGFISDWKKLGHE